MTINLANLTLLFPAACTLAVILAMTGSQVVRPKLDVVRTFVQVVVWLLFALAMFGLFVRQITLGIFLFTGVVTIVISVITWERSLARNTILLALLAHYEKPNRMLGIARYLKLEGLGYWKRLGLSFERALSVTGNWILATKLSKIARDEYDYMALAMLEQTGDLEASRAQLMRSIELRQLGSQWRGRLAAASYSLGPLLVIGLMYGPGWGVLGGTFLKLTEEIGMSRNPWMVSWLNISRLQLHIIVPLLAWGGLMTAYFIKTFPILTRQLPISWFFRSYHRALCLEGLAEIIRAQPQVAQACRQVAQAIPVASWSGRMNQAAARMDAGEEIASALKKNGLIKHQESTVLSLCQDHHSLSWTLKEISQSIWQKSESRTNLLIQFLVLLIVLVSAWLTAMIAMSVIGTISEMIWSVESQSTR